MSATKRSSSTKVWLSTLFVLLCSFGTSPAHAQEEQKWGTKSARTIEQGRLEAGLLSPWRYGLAKHMEVAATPQSFFLLPSVTIKDNFYGDGYFFLASSHRFAVPTPLLHVLAREGSGGLLPRDADIPFVFQTEHQLLATARTRNHLLTVRGGFGIGFSGEADLSMIEFPFLYSELAPVYAPIVGRFGWIAEGLVTGPVDYQLVHRLSSWKPRADIPWPGDDTPSVLSQEFAGRLRFRAGKRHRFSVGVAATVADYPIGTRFHWTPTFDYRFALLR